MGYYIEAPSNHGKAKYLVAQHGATIISQDQAEHYFDRGGPQDLGIICVVDNQIFEAAGFCFNQQEFKEFADPRDARPKTWLMMDRELAEKLSGYSKEPSREIRL